MNNKYRLLQLTNVSLGAVPGAVGSFLPLGTVTRQIIRDTACRATFDVTTNVANTIYIREPGFYKITYNGFLTVAAAGTINVNLKINGQTVAIGTVTAGAAGTYAMPITFMTRVLNNCCGNVNNLPISVQFENVGIALTGGSSNLIIERVD